MTNNMMNSTAVYPGTFDPMTLGHFDLISRAAKLYDHLIVAVASTSIKNGALFSCEERVEMIRQEIAAAKLTNVSVEVLDSLLVNFCKKHGSKIVIRGVRVYSDFEYEFQMALTNRKLNSEIETLFMMPSENLSYVSASMVRELIRYNGDYTSFVTPIVADRLKKIQEKS